MSIENKCCPICGGEVSFPRKEIAEVFEWKKSSVCCSKGHLIDVSECKEIKGKGARKIKSSHKKI